MIPCRTSLLDGFRVYRKEVNSLASYRSLQFGVVRGIVSPAFIFILNVLLIYPLFTGECTRHMGSIESAFISDARFIDENGFANWNPLWYCGFPFHLSYTPLIPYLTVVTHWMIPTISIPQSYRLITALAYAFGPVTLFLFVKYLTRKELTAFITAIIYSVALMPIYGATPFVAELVKDLKYIPYGLIVLAFFGEGPHILGLTAIPLAALALLHSLRGPGFKRYVYASLAIAAVALANLIALYAFALISAIILLGEALRGEAMRKTKRVLTCGAISCGLVAFCYDLSFIEASVSFGIFGGGGYVLTWRNFAEMAIILTAALTVLSLYFKKKPESQPLFVASAWTVVFLIIPAVWYFFNVPLAPQPGRYIPELNIGVSILLGIAITDIFEKLAGAVPTGVRRVWRPLSFIVISAIVLVLPFTRSTWEVTYPNQDIEETSEYNIAKWLEEHTGVHRVYATGTVCFWLNVFTSVPQLRGGSDQGSTNPWWIHVAYEIDNGDDGELGVLWCKALGIRYIVVIYPNADTPYHDYIFPNKFEGVLPLRHTYKGFAVFEVPLNHPELIQPVEVVSLQDFGRIKGVRDVEGLSGYVDAVEATPTAICSYRFDGVDRLTITVINATESTGILVKMTFDKRWKAYAEGGEVAITAVGPSFMLVTPEKRGSYELRLVCEKALSEVFGIVISVVTIALISAVTAYNSGKCLPRRQRQH